MEGIHSTRWLVSRSPPTHAALWQRVGESFLPACRLLSICAALHRAYSQEMWIYVRGVYVVSVSLHSSSRGAGRQEDEKKERRREEEKKPHSERQVSEKKKEKTTSQTFLWKARFIHAFRLFVLSYLSYLHKLSVRLSSQVSILCRLCEPASRAGKQAYLSISLFAPSL